MATLSPGHSGAPRLVCITGPQGQGKTTAAVSISHTPENPQDTVLVGFDVDATVGLQARGISVPQYDLSGISDWPTLELEIKDVVAKLKANPPKALIIDTISSLDRAIVTYWISKSADKYILYNNVLSKHRWFLMDQILPLRIPTVALFHTSYRELADGQKKDERAKQIHKLAAEGLSEDADKLLDITGKAANLYRAQASLICPVREVQEGMKRQYYLYPNGITGFESKNRFRDLLADKEPADLNKLFKKIAAGRIPSNKENSANAN